MVKRQLAQNANKNQAAMQKLPNFAMIGIKIRRQKRHFRQSLTSLNAQL